MQYSSTCRRHSPDVDAGFIKYLHKLTVDWQLHGVDQNSKE